MLLETTELINSYYEFHKTMLIFYCNENTNFYCLKPRFYKSYRSKSQSRLQNKSLQIKVEYRPPPGLEAALSLEILP